MHKIEIYTRPWCGYCARALALLERKGLAYTQVDVTDDRNRELEMMRRSGGWTVPQIFIDGRAIGGHDDLLQIERSGSLDRLISAVGSRADTNLKE